MDCPYSAACDRNRDPRPPPCPRTTAARGPWPPLKAWGAHMAIRDFEAVDALARGIGLRLIEDLAMPANNRCLVWTR